MTGLVAVVMIFSIPIIAIVTNHFQTQSKIKHKMIREEIELEKLKHENFLLETEKMKLELEQIKIGESPNNKQVF
ncbi:hypothetical protein WQ54_01180 [Bacillus sp. SA1-12]|uniref:hypothetical protein n=1 Tax=Bacillus sp. SA1-12 TaxID=1455638 RepID=UPI0006253EA9|nr:hypothetical protein [Bacillus sp. SA1-12]KKI94179.1 hypothetical protein WQ54_01180 [Bacillus sp. SA1-12]